MTKEEDEGRINEARNLAADAVDAAKAGDTQQAEFLLQEAAEMDAATAAEAMVGVKRIQKRDEPAERPHDTP